MTSRTEAVQVRPCQDGPGDLCGSKLAAEILGVERTRIARYQREKKMPPKLAQLPSGPVWLRADIEAMARRRAKADR